MKILNSILFVGLLSFVGSMSQAAVTKWSSTLPKNSNFGPSKELEARVDFWQKIYSVYSTKQGVFHLNDEIETILGEVDLTSIYDNAVYSDATKKRLAKKEIEKKRREVAAKFKIADIKRVRLQMGLRDRMQKALFLSGRYLPMMEKIFKKHGLPIELTRIVFVESSFNILAQSKVGASGLWQIMPSVARPHGYITAHYDKRNHPIYATELAARILKENYKKLGSWPLAITAYNHGLTGVRRMTNVAKSEQIEDLIESDERTRTWGFASKNFYSCFLAVLEVERSATELFGENLLQSVAMNAKEVRLRQSLPKSKVLPWFNGSLTRLKQMNPHLNWTKIMRNKKLPAGIPLQVPKENYHLAVNEKS